MADLEIRNLHVRIDETEILKGLNLKINKGEVHAIMGPNGTGKSTLAYTLMGHPGYEVTDGEILFKGQDLLELEPNERSVLGMFLAFQYPVAIPGVTLANFLRSALNARRKAVNPEDKGIPVPEFRKFLKAKMDLLKMDHSFAGRYLNDGFSGGEKKRAEILQMATLQPEIAILDETDSGLDIDALRIVSEGVNTLRGPEMGVLVITHYQRILNYIKPDYVHIMLAGQIVESGGADLALHLEEHGYDLLREKYTA
ncbi:cysteine desulfurase [Ornatilinea apprima]|uniref:Cysteine desulfurase n=1 Tax=Ornatilinea apprima TaxID=1134406 RepID=A0A0P6WQ47_9CHLR|nr:Fe-S cluster assembly ATPase SufC [Ornatilinea apprima]KPL72200.1 cysteine desulfurase [Ornatilinea apprima]